MKLNFSFNSHTYDLWGIYEAIKKYYPIGIHRSEGEGIYFAYSGIKELEKLIIDNIHDNEHWRERWENFAQKIGEELNKEIMGTTYGQSPGFSSSVILERNKAGHCIHNKELHFSVSLIGNFYQIYGLDTTTILEDGERGGYTSRNVVTPSPYKEFADSFKFVEQKIQEKYPKHKIVPFAFGQTIIRGLQVRYLDDEDCSINKALFNHFLEDVPEFARGDDYYGIEQWKKK